MNSHAETLANARTLVLNGEDFLAQTQLTIVAKLTPREAGEFIANVKQEQPMAAAAPVVEPEPIAAPDVEVEPVTVEDQLEAEKAYADELRLAAMEATDKALELEAENYRLIAENYAYKKHKKLPITPEEQEQFGKALKYEEAKRARIAEELKKPPVKITRMSQFVGKKLYWLWENRIPFGALSTIAGDPDEGKSLITLYIAARVSTGEKLFDNPVETEPLEVLLLSAEDDADITLRPRLEVAGANLNRVHLFESVLLRDGAGKTMGERMAQLDSDIQVICQFLDSHPEVKVIVIDPISSFLGKANMNREQEVRMVLQPLATRAKRDGLAVIMVAHFNKNSDTRSAMDRVGGAKAIVGMGRSAWTCVREPEKESEAGKPIHLTDRRLFLKLKGNLAPSKIGGLVYTIRAKGVNVEDKDGKIVQVNQPFIEWIETTQHTAQDIVIGEKPGAPKVGKTKQAETILREFLEQAGGSADSNKIKDAMPFELSTLHRARKALNLWTEWTSQDDRPVSIWGLPDAKKPKPLEGGPPAKKRRKVVKLSEPMAVPSGLEVEPETVGSH